MSDPTGASANVLLLVERHTPPTLAEKLADRDRLVGQVLALNVEIARLQTLLLVAGTGEGTP